MKEKEPAYARILLLIILITGIILRFWNYSGWSLSNDELSAMARLQFPGFFRMIRDGVMLNDMHPPGVQAFLWFWTGIFGNSQALFRLPFVLAGCFSIYVFYRIGYKWFGFQTALISTAVFSTLSYLVLYSQLARPYSFGLLFALLFADAWTNLLIRNIRTIAKPGFPQYTYFVLAGVACMYTHYFCFMVAGIIGVSGLFYIKDKRSLINYLLAGIAMFILYLPAIKVTIYQFSIGGLGGPEGWLGPPPKNAITQFLGYAFNDSFPYFLFMVFIFIAGFFFKAPAGEWKLRFIAFAWAMLPVFIAYYYSLLVNPVFQYSILIFGFPFLLLFLLAGIKFRKDVLIVSVSLVLLATGVYSMVFRQHFYSKPQFAVFKEIAELTAEYSHLHGDDKVERTVNVISPYYIQYYLDKIAPGMKYSLYHTTSPDELRSLDSLVAGSDRPYFLHAWTNTFHAMETEQIIRSRYPYLTERDSFFNAGLILFSKSGKESQLQKFSFDSLEVLKSLPENPDSGYVHIGPSVEYSKTFRLKAAEARLEKGSTIESHVQIYPISDLSPETQLVFSIENEKGNIAWRSRPLRDFALKKGEWQNVYFAYTFNEEIHPGDNLVVYIWNNGKSDFRARNFFLGVR